MTREDYIRMIINKTVILFAVELQSMAHVEYSYDQDKSLGSVVGSGKWVSPFPSSFVGVDK